ncbi:helix-turn-helix domain-containing protein [Streptococcus dentasini]
MRGCDDEIIDFCLTAKWENGDATPDLENLVKLSEILKVNLDELVKGKQQSTFQIDEDDGNLHLLKGREYVINPETGKYEKRDGLTIIVDLLSEYWWVLLATVPLLFIFL